MGKADDSEKASLRRHFLAVRKGIREQQRLQWGREICRKANDVIGLAPPTCFSYCAMDGEVDTFPILRRFYHSGTTIYVPAPNVRAYPEEGFSRLNFETEQGQLTGCTTSLEEVLQSLQVILVPGIVWDVRGYRIGFGGGYFDRLLAKLNPGCTKVGLCYDAQLTEQVPTDPWDQPVDVLITNSEVFPSGSQR